MKTVDHFALLLSAFAIIAACLSWAADIIRARHVHGSEFAVKLGQGYFVVSNQNSVPVDLRLTSFGDQGFSVDSDQTRLMFSSERSIEGRQQHMLNLSIVPGRSEYRVVTGRDITMTFQHSFSIDVYTFPHTTESARDAIRLPAGIVASTLFGVVFVYGRRWLRGLR